jgi:septal ring factor EnvC (AmiA/AmiB activator)
MFYTSQKLYIVIFIFFCLISANHKVIARDISNEQRAVSEARLEQIAAKTEVEENAKKIADQEKDIADEQTRLQALKLAQKTAQARLDRANAQLEQNLSILEKAWPERNR